MSETVLVHEPLVRQQAGVRAVVAELFQSRLFVVLISFLIVYLHIIHNGYECFRSDHITQIPLIYMQADHSLYPSDWFLQRFAHFDVRFFHLFLIRLFAAPLGLPSGILALYLVLMVATVWAWAEISKKIYNSPLPGLVTAVAAVYFYGVEIGTNHLLEKIMIPRTEAFAFAYWGLFCLLASRPFIVEKPHARWRMFWACFYLMISPPFVAGVLMGLSAYCQMAVGGLFALPMLIWMALPGRGPRRWKTLGLFVSGFVLLLLYPLLFKSKGFLAHQTVSDADAIRLSAYIRHPHHMIPHLWGGMWLAFVFLAALAGRQWRRMKTTFPAAWDLGWLGVCTIGILAVATIFIEIIPVKNMIMGQPYRMAVLLYLVMFLLVSPYLLELLSRPDLLSKVRFALLCFGMENWRIFSLVALIELIISHRESKGRPLAPKLQWILLLTAVIAASLKLDPESRLHLKLDGDAKDILKVMAIAIVAIMLVARYRVLERPRLVWGAVAGGTLACILWTSSFFWLPYQKWIDDEDSKYQKKAGMLCYDFQFKPIPIMALERLGAWAEKNTPKDSLFIIPPEREMYGFHLWAKRSAVYAFKFFPYNPAGMADWKERYLAHHGIFDLKSEADRKAAEAAMNDIGGELVNDAFFALSADQMLTLATRYKADYVITQTNYTAKTTRLKLLTSDYNRTKSSDHGKPYYLYQVVKEPNAPKAGQTT